MNELYSAIILWIAGVISLTLVVRKYRAIERDQDENSFGPMMIGTLSVIGVTSLAFAAFMLYSYIT